MWGFASVVPNNNIKKWEVMASNYNCDERESKRVCVPLIRKYSFSFFNMEDRYKTREYNVLFLHFSFYVHLMIKFYFIVCTCMITFMYLIFSWKNAYIVIEFHGATCQLFMKERQCKCNTTNLETVRQIISGNMAFTFSYVSNEIMLLRFSFWPI